MNPVTSSQLLATLGGVCQFGGAVVVAWGVRLALRDRPVRSYANTPGEDWRGNDSRVSTLQLRQEQIWQLNRQANLGQLVGFVLFSVGIALATASAFT